MVNFSETMWSNIKRLGVVALFVMAGITSRTAGVDINKLENAEFSGTELVAELGKGLQKTDKFDGMDDYEIYEYVVQDVTSSRRIKNSDTVSPAEDFEYEETNNGICITRYNGVDTEVEIPAKIDGKAVIEIGREAFAENIFLEKVMLPDTVLAIRSGAFKNCGKLQRVEASSRLAIIEAYAFENCSMLTSMEKKESEDGIGYFYIESCAFLHCNSLKSFDFAGETFEEMHIDADAFNGCSFMQSVRFSPNIKYLDDRAFQDCTSLTEVTIPGGIRELGYGVFLNCTNLAKVTLEGRERGEGDYGTYCRNEIFAGTAITEITIPSSYAGIPGNAFRNCVNLEKVTLEPRRIAPNEEGRRLEYGAFAGTAITEITVPGDFYSVGNHAFAECPNLTRFTWEGSGKNTADQYMDERVFQDSYAITEIHLPITMADIFYWDAAAMGEATVYIPAGNMVADILREYGIKVVEE